MWARLTGHRTYIQAAAIALIVGAKYAGVLPADTANLLLGLLGAGGLATLRAAVK